MATIKVINNTVQFQTASDSAWQTIPKGSSKTITKNNRIRKTTESGSISVSCQNGSSDFDLSEVNVSYSLSQICPNDPPKSSENNDIPFILIPSKTSLLSNQPIIRWNKVNDATSYTIKLIDKDINEIWTKDVNSSVVCQGNFCEFKYSGTSLRNNQKYSFIIDTNTGKSSEQSNDLNIAFQIIDMPSEAKIRIDEIKAENLSPTEIALKISKIYEEYNLIVDAVLILEQLSESDKTSDVYCQLGEFYYYYLDLPVKGAELLEIAISKATKTKQTATAQLELAEIKIIFGKEDEAKTLLEQSLINYKTLGEVEHKEHIDYINEKIKQVS